ncbi:MAG: hypothetical protein ABL868_10350, partial [Sulfuriferula sp.]
MKYQRTIEELEEHAVKWWPKELEETVASASVIPTLLASQEQFICILKLSGIKPNQIFDVLSASGMPANLFLKHLAVLADYGGELIKRIGREFSSTFDIDAHTQKPVMRYIFKGEQHNYAFEALPTKGLGNTKLKLDGIAITKPQPLSPLYRDLIMILIHGATADVAHLAALEKCEIGSLLGDEVAIDRYIKEKYLHVSRITTGASTNHLGQIAQTWVLETLRKHLPNNITIHRNGTIQLSGHDKASGMPFDIVCEQGKTKIGLEVSFQVTTNSVIERKAGLAKSRQLLMHEHGYHIAYIVDG